MNELDELIKKSAVAEVAPGAYAASFMLPLETELFKGHFPQKAIVPGVVLIEAVRQAAAIALNQKVTIKEIKQVKFKGLVLPDEVITIDFTIKEDGSIYVVKANLKLSDEQKAKMQLTLAQCENSTN